MTAKRSAFANALKIDSTWWCDERPYINFRCTLAAAACAERAKEILHQLGLEIAHARGGDFVAADAIRAAGKIERGGGEAIVHRHEEISGAQDAALRAERLFHRFAERDADVLDGVVLIDVEIAARREVEIERAVAGDLFEHVVEETNARGDAGFALAVEIQAQAMSVSFVVRRSFAFLMRHPWLSDDAALPFRRQGKRPRRRSI